jgi:hypothetical protein
MRLELDLLFDSAGATLCRISSGKQLLSDVNNFYSIYNRRECYHSQYKGLNLVSCCSFSILNSSSVVK